MMLREEKVVTTADVENFYNKIREEKNDMKLDNNQIGTDDQNKKYTTVRKDILNDI